MAKIAILEANCYEVRQRYIDYAEYNIWANKRLISELQSLEDQMMYQEFVSSFPTIRDTILHLWYAEVGWLSRIKGRGWKVAEVTEFEGSNAVLFESWTTTSKNFRDFLREVDLEKEIEFKSREIVYSIPVREIAQTVFNHGSYHRGQIVTMLRQLGVESIQQTDYIEWVRENARKKS